jgi:hypothetical protein
MRRTSTHERLQIEGVIAALCAYLAEGELNNKLSLGIL